MKQKSITLPDDLFNRLMKEKKRTTIPANAIIVTALIKHLDENDVERIKMKQLKKLSTHAHN